MYKTFLLNNHLDVSCFILAKENDSVLLGVHTPASHVHIDQSIIPLYHFNMLD